MSTTIGTDPNLAAERQHEDRVECECRAAIELEEAEAIAKKERKKNRAMHLTILAGVRLPDCSLVTVAANIMKDYHQMKFVYLWHHTNKALHSVDYGTAMVESKMLEQIVTDSVPSLVPAHILKTAKALIKDEDQQFWKYSIASQRSLAAMQEAGWCPEAETRQCWYLETNKPGGSMFDISVINEATLARAQTQAQKLNYASMISGMKQQFISRRAPVWWNMEEGNLADITVPIASCAK
ncbi:hypothetical protein DFP72DRAFT_858141 [Ephemerocybe angulata]|uniref:Uncharacterized protein n=1 Tax=Ephemerocybe angulata TaxID=980116 RepID=A0A8H6HD00_9AGAR|nr:hypothetical protein DFP72DRAFT_858141 [Tulosesus angulatus]